MPRDSNLPPRFWADSANGDISGSQRRRTRGQRHMSVFMARTGRRPIRSLGCVVRLHYPRKRCGSWMIGEWLQVWGWLSVWIPEIGARESRGVTPYEGTASMLPDDGSAAEGPRCKPAEIDQTTQATDPTPTKDNTEGIRNSDNERSAPPP